MPQVESNAEVETEVAGFVRLDLSLELCDRVRDEAPGHWKLTATQRKASVVECSRLLRQVDHWIGVAEAASHQIAPVSADDSDLVERYGKLTFEVGRSQVESLHYGSPFAMQVLLGALAPPGLGVLFYGAKRLFGADLEFRAYREQRRVEYLHAKEIAEAFEREAPVKVDAQVKPRIEEMFLWRMKEGVVTDETE